MIFNPLFIDSDNGQLNLLSSVKSSGSHLFQDIIKLEDEMLTKREFNSSSILPSLLSEVKKMKTGGEYNSKMLSSNLVNINQNQGQITASEFSQEVTGFENLSEDDIHNLLQKVFSEVESESKQVSMSDDILANLNTEDLVSEIEQRLTEQGDVKCLISNVDDNTNLLLTIQKVKSSEQTETDSDNGIILNGSTENEDLEDNYVLKILELGQDDDLNSDSVINSGLLGSSLLMQLMNQSSSSDAISIEELPEVNNSIQNNLFPSQKVNSVDMESVIPTQVTIDGNEETIQDVVDEIIPNAAKKSSDTNPVIGNKETIPDVIEETIPNTTKKSSDINPVTGNEEKQTLQNVKATDSLFELIPTPTNDEIGDNGLNAVNTVNNEANETNTKNSQFDFLVKISAKEMSQVSDEDLLAGMDLRSRVNPKVESNNTVRINNGTASSLTGQDDLDDTATNTAETKDVKVSINDNIDNLLKHSPDTNVNIESVKKESGNSLSVKDSDVKSLNVDKAGSESTPVKENSGSNSNNSESASGESGREDNSLGNTGSDNEVKSQNDFKIEEPGNNILQHNSQTQETSTRVVKIDLQNLANLHLAREVSDEISEMVISKSSDKATIVLEPQELGKIKVSIEVTDSHVHAKLEVENNTVKEMLQSNSDNLKQNLNNSGLQLGSLNISLQQNTAKENNETSTKQTRRNEKVAEVNEQDGSTTEAVRNKSMGYNTYEYII